MERWRLMEEFENVARNQPVFPGDTISHQGANALDTAGMIERNVDGNWILSDAGRGFWVMWSRIPAEAGM